MPKVALYNMKAEQVGEIELSDNIFGITPNMPVMHSAVVAYLANQRQGTQSALTRAEVRGGGIKPWRQKGTGRARQGSTRSPQWTHGGVAFAPKPRSYTKSMNKKARRLALCSALSTKVSEGGLIVVDSIELDEIKTKRMAEMMKAFAVDTKILLVTNGEEKVVKSARNLKGITPVRADSLNTYEMLLNDKCIVTKQAIEKIEEVFGK